MSIFRVNKTKNFTVVNNHILRNKAASLKAKGLLVWMLSCDEDWNFSLEGMKNCMKEGDDSIRSGLKELEELGYLERIKLMPESYTNELGEKVVVRSQIEYIYNVYEQPVENQRQEILYTENQYVEVQCIENPAQRNTNIKEELKGKEIPINEEPEPEAPPSTDNQIKISSKRNFRQEHEKLEDILESGRDIDIQKQKKKKSPLEKMKDDCMDEIDRRNFDEETKNILKEYFEWASSGKDVRRIKSYDLWKSKLNALEQIVKRTGDSACEIVKQSIDNGWYKFEELNKAKTENNKNSHEPLSDKVEYRSSEEAQKDLDAKKADPNQKWY